MAASIRATMKWKGSDSIPADADNGGSDPTSVSIGLDPAGQQDLMPAEALKLTFDRYLAELTPEGFVREVLLERCAVRELVIGHDHGFGRGRSGDVETLRRMGAVEGFKVDVVPPVDVGGQHVSSAHRHPIQAARISSPRGRGGRHVGATRCPPRLRR